MPTTNVGVSIGHYEAIQAIYTLINNNEDFRPDDWSVDQAEVLIRAGRYILEGLGRPIATSWPDLLREFSETFGHHVGTVPEVPPDGVVTLRIRLIEEELSELRAAMVDDDLVAIAHEACDLIYVTIGTLLAYGIPVEETFRAVHTANLTKSQERREDRKALKGDGYRSPDIAGLLRAQGWEG